MRATAAVALLAAGGLCMPLDSSSKFVDSITLSFEELQSDIPVEKWKMFLRSYQVVATNH